LKILILSECVATKKYDPSKEPIKSILERHGLQVPACDLENEDKYKEVLKQYILPAYLMYKGSFKFINELVANFRKRGDEVKLLIISARYGLIDENTPIIPYQCTFKSLNKDEIRERAKKLQIYEKLIEKIRNECFDLSIIVLGKNYLLTVFDESESKDFFMELKTKELIVFGSKNLERTIQCKEAELKFIPVIGIGDRNKKMKVLTNYLFNTRLSYYT
jgi:cytoplasmic iron level regulating protein YaaA (DUF328/UPF0246 family)